LPPLAGTLSASGKIKIGFFTQHQVEELEAEDSPLQHMTRAMPDAKPGQVRGQLGRFGFSGDMAEQRVGSLSGGERARLALALITREAPHMMILDEPTNHLDVDAREALVQALNEYGGAVVIVSHDRHLVEMTADRLILVADGTAKDYPDSLDDYRDMVLRRGLGMGGEGASKPAPRASRKDERRQAAAARERTQALRAAIRVAEAEVARLSARRTEIDRIMFDPASYEGPEKNLTMTELMKARTDVERKLAVAEARWVAASEALEAAEPDAA
jgi:ATP-binding cassette subfamily F protein 3